MRIIAYLLTILVFSSAAASTPPAQKKQENVIIRWNALMMQAIRNEDTAPTLSTRNLAILNCSIYDAVNSITRTHQPYLSLINTSPDASMSAAVTAAGQAVMDQLYPALHARTEALYHQLRSEMGDTKEIVAGLALGREAAHRLLAIRSADKSSTMVPYIPSTVIGQWRRTPPYFRPPVDPHWRSVTLFGLPDKEDFTPGPPPPLDSKEYAEAYDEVKRIGGKRSDVRTPEQGEIAVFWSDFSYTAMPPGHWHEIAADIVVDQKTSLEDSARLFALLSIAQADAAIICWESKYLYNTWRPITAIRKAADDNNPLTVADPAWDHLLAAPNFPEYTSGHSTFSKASAVILSRFYGTDAISFTARSDTISKTRSFKSLSACADEVGMSRIYGGIHFQFSNVEGKRCGEKIATYVFDHLLLAADTTSASKSNALPN